MFGSQVERISQIKIDAAALAPRVLAHRISALALRVGFVLVFVLLRFGLALDLAPFKTNEHGETI